jgi:hypothetical protein
MEKVIAIMAEAGTALAGATTQAELWNLAGQGGLIACLVWAVKFLAAKWDASQQKLVELLERTITRNTDALHDVRDVLAWCRHKHSGESEAAFKKRQEEEHKL